MTDHLTPAQRDALQILSEATGPLGAWRRSSTRSPVARVNIRAVGSLVRAGLARMHFAPSHAWSPYVHNETYSITAAGRAAAAAIADRSPGNGRQDDR